MNGFNFTEKARQILAIAREEAVALEHEYVGTEHILLGLIREGDNVAGTVLQKLGADPDAIRELVLRIVRRGPRSPSGPDLPYTNRGKKVLELAMAEAQELRHAYVGTEHLLLGLLREENGIAAQVLVDRGVTLDRARTEVLRLLGIPGAAADGGIAGREARGAQTRPPNAFADQAAWASLRSALDACQRLGTTPTLTLEADGTLTVPLGPDLVVSVELPPGVRLRRRDAGPQTGAPESPPQERA